MSDKKQINLNDLTVHEAVDIIDQLTQKGFDRSSSVAIHMSLETIKSFISQVKEGAITEKSTD